MNHWPLEQAGLSELYQPLTTLMERLVPSGEASARTFYGDEADGWVLHMMTNVWNYTAPGEHPPGERPIPVVRGCVPICGNTICIRKTGIICVVFIPS